MDALLNWLWQGTAVALAAGAVLATLRTASAAVRYGLCWVALLLVLLLPALSAVSRPAPVERGLDTRYTQVVRIVPLVALPSTLDLASPFLLFWTLWSAVLGGRAGLDLIRVHRTRRACGPFPPGREDRLAHWRTRRSGQIARLVVSERIPSAALLGIRSPLIAVSPALLHTLDDQELDLIVMHERAHVERHDAIAVILQLFVRVLVGWHPGVWWLDRRLHAEREAACDDRTVALTGSARAYAACLLKLAGMRTGSPAPLPVPAALAASRVGERIARLMHDQAPMPPLRSAATTIAAVTMLAAVGIALGHVQLVATTVPEIGSGGETRALRQAAFEARHAASVPTGREAHSPAGEPGDRKTERRTIGRPGNRTTERSPDRTTQHPDNRTTEPPDDRATGFWKDRSVRRVSAARLPAEPSSRAAAPPSSGPIPVTAMTGTGILVGSSSTVSLPEASVARERPSPTSGSGEDPGFSWRTAAPRADSSGIEVPWRTVADAGAAAGNGSQKTAVTTARVFTKLGRKIAGAF